MDKKWLGMAHADRILLMRANDLVRLGHHSVRHRSYGSLIDRTLEDRYQEFKKDLTREFHSTRVDRNKRYLYDLIHLESSKRKRWGEKHNTSGFISNGWILY